MALEFKLPDIGEGTVEGEIVRWIVKPGDRVKADDPVVEVMTDKATVVLTAPKAGVIREIKAEAGKVAKVGSILYVLDTDAAGQGAGKAAAGEAPREARERTAPREAARTAASGGTENGGRGGTGAATATATAPLPEVERKPLATPATRKLARELGVDLATVTPTGPNGRITDDDVRSAASGGARPAAAPAREPARLEAPQEAAAAIAPPAAAPLPAPAAAAAVVTGAEEVEHIPFRGIRKAIAAAMVKSKFTATHYTYVEECDMTEIVKLREREKPRAEKAGVKLTYLPFIIKATIAALKKHPILNAELDEQKQEILLKKYYHIGISTQTDAGLTVPVLRHADRRSIYDLAREMDRLISAARTGKSTPQDLKGSTFTITSAGNIGGVFATPIINFPNVAILGVNQIKKRPVVRTNEKGEDEIAIRHMMYFSISLDHRVVDGAIAAYFMNDLISFLEDPTRLAMEA